MKLKLYALRDSKSGLFYSPATGYNDKNVIAFYKHLTTSVLEDNKSEEFAKLKLLDSQIYKLGEINLETGELTNDNNFLSNLVTLEDLVEESEKNEI